VAGGTKPDVLDELSEIPVLSVTRSTERLRPTRLHRLAGYDKIECIYKKLPGWRTSTEGITDYEKIAQAGAGLFGIHREGGGSEGGHDLHRARTATIPSWWDEFVSELRRLREKLESLPRQTS